ncbi:MAG: winged helix-turn-helix domain-containing protein [Thermoplasmata archaeon]
MTNRKLGEENRKKIMKIIRNHDGIGFTEIKKKTGLSDPAVTNNLNKLKEKGRIVKKVDPKNGKRKPYYPSEEEKKKPVFQGKIFFELLNKKIKSHMHIERGCMLNESPGFTRQSLKSTIKDNLKKSVNIDDYDPWIIFENELDFIRQKWVTVYISYLMEEDMEEYIKLLNRVDENNLTEEDEYMIERFPFETEYKTRMEYSPNLINIPDEEIEKKPLGDILIFLHITSLLNIPEYDLVSFDMPTSFKHNVYQDIFQEKWGELIAPKYLYCMEFATKKLYEIMLNRKDIDEYQTKILRHTITHFVDLSESPYLPEEPLIYKNKKLNIEDLVEMKKIKKDPIERYEEYLDFLEQKKTFDIIEEKIDLQLDKDKKGLKEANLYKKIIDKRENKEEKSLMEMFREEKAKHT